MSMKARATWVDGRMFVGESGSGHSVVMDGAPESGGRNAGIRPMEMLLIGLAGCTAFDVVLILERGREQISFCVVDVEAERAESDPKIFTRIKLIYRLTGKDLSRAKAERAVALSAEKYCSASIMLGATAEISHDIELIPAE
jgi:putative redox protein